MARPRRREELTEEQRHCGWAQPALPGRHQWVVGHALALQIPERNRKWNEEAVLFRCQCKTMGLNFIPREAEIWMPLRRSPTGAMTENRSKMDKVLELIFGALPPLDFRVIGKDSQVVGVNFWGRCYRKIIRDNSVRGWRQVARIDVDSIEPYQGKRPLLPFFPVDDAAAVR